MIDVIVLDGTIGGARGIMSYNQFITWYLEGRVRVFITETSMISGYKIMDSKDIRVPVYPWRVCNCGSGYSCVECPEDTEYCG